MSPCIRFVGITTMMAIGCATNQSSRRALPPPAEASGEAVAEDVVPSEKLDEIQQILQRKQQDVAHCWTDEATRQHNRNLTIDLMLRLTVGTGGRAQRVEIVKNSVNSKEFNECVITMVKNFDFPAIPSSVELTWPYSFKPLY